MFPIELSGSNVSDSLIEKDRQPVINKCETRIKASTKSSCKSKENGAKYDIILRPDFVCGMVASMRK